MCFPFWQRMSAELFTRTSPPATVGSSLEFALRCAPTRLSTPPAVALGGARARRSVVLGGAALLVGLLAILVGLAFAGSPSELAAGTQVAGVDVGGLTKREAIAKLDALFEQRSDDPVEFVAGKSSYSLRGEPTRRPAGLERRRRGSRTRRRRLRPASWLSPDPRARVRRRGPATPRRLERRARVRTRPDRRGRESAPAERCARAARAARPGRARADGKPPRS